MVDIPLGRFFMGSPASEARYGDYDGREEPRHLVQLNTKFAMGVAPVTVDAFAEFIAESGWDMGDSAFVFADGKWQDTKGRGWLNPGFAQDGDHPVTCVSWNDAKAYLDWLNRRLGLTGRSDTYRLPTEAEWEYDCRAGTQTPFSLGSTLSTDQANYDGNFAYGSGKATKTWRQGTTAVGEFELNPFGLYDMHGNVWEGCEDVWHDTYEGAPADGSPWVDGDSSLRVLRGGSWSDSPVDCRSATRYGGDATDRDGNGGFRLARTLSGPPS